MPPSETPVSPTRILICCLIMVTALAQLPSISQYHILPIDPVLKEAVVGIPYQQVFDIYPSSLNLSSVRFLNASGLPSGLRLENSTVTGTPDVAGNYTVRIQAQIHSLMIQIDANFTLSIKAASILNSSIPNIKLGTQFSLTFVARGGIPPLTWTFQRLPVWASSNGSTLTGRPTAFGNFPFNVTITDSRNNTLTQNYSLFVESQGSGLKISPEEITVTSKVLYSFLLTPSGGSPPYIIQYPNKPSWLTVNQNLVQIFAPDMGEFFFAALIIDSRGNFQSVNVKVNSVNQQAGLIDYINRATTNIVDPRTGIKVTIFNNNWMDNGTSETRNTPAASVRPQTSSIPTPTSTSLNDTLSRSSYIKNNNTLSNDTSPCQVQPNTQSSIGTIKQVKYIESQILLNNDVTLQFQSCTRQSFRNRSTEFKAGDSVAFSGNPRGEKQWFVHSISNLS